MLFSMFLSLNNRFYNMFIKSDDALKNDYLVKMKLSYSCSLVREDKRKNMFSINVSASNWIFSLN